MGFLCKPTKQTSTTSLPGWLDQGAQDMLKRVQEFYDKPYQPYTGQRIAGFNADEKNAFQGFRDMQGPGVTNEALDMVRQGSGSALPGMEQYQNKYLDDVLGTAVRKINEGAATQRKGIDAKANMAGAFGDTGYAGAQAKLNADTQQQVGDAAGQIGAAGFNTALGASQADLARLMQGGQALTSTEAQGQNSMLQRLTALLSGGQIQQGNAQAGLDTKYEAWQNQNQDAYSRLQALISAISGAPHGSTTTATSPNTSWAGLLGSLGSAAIGKI